MSISTGFADGENLLLEAIVRLLFCSLVLLRMYSVGIHEDKAPSSVHFCLAKEQHSGSHKGLCHY
ncbi:MAG: hypothetical protein ACI89Z_001281 [Porticoccus sp.]|jgi:hypothetical protein